MSDRNEKYREKYMAAVADQIGERPGAVGQFQRSGMARTMGLSAVSPLAGMLSGRAAKKKSGGLPEQIILAVTDDKVYVFEFKPTGLNVKVKDPLVIWDRSQMTAERLKEGGMWDRLRLHVPDRDEPLDLTSNKMPGSSEDFNAPVIDVLVG
jgi:hypothetical protein